VATPAPNLGFGRSNGGPAYVAATTFGAMDPNTIAIAGGSFPHNNMMPYLTLSFCIALQGVYPPRT
jgi:microcystin-dependent protein